MNAGHGLTLNLGNHQKQINIRLKQLQQQDFARRLWGQKEHLWMKENIQSEISNHFIGWLNVVEKMLERLPSIHTFCNSIHSAEIDHIVLLGMGGSSLSSLVFQKTFVRNSSTSIKFHILDSTDAETIKKIENKINISTTLFIVSSKSGSTTEVIALYNLFFKRLYDLKGERAGENFIAITDAESPLCKLAHRNKFRKVFINFPDIGGRFSALSYFGILPAALMGINVQEILERAQLMVKACSPDVPAAQNPGIVLGAVIAELASLGYDKLTYLLPPALRSFGLWLEQLVAESTGKNGKGILPLNGFPLIETSSYGNDRAFFELKISGKKNSLQSKRLYDFITIDYPVISIEIKDELDLGQEFFRWEIATVTTGFILGINPFNQPNVEESKINTIQLLKTINQEGLFSETKPSLTEKCLTYYSLKKATNAKRLVTDFINSLQPGDYISLQAYLPEQPEVKKQILQMKEYIQRNLCVAVTSEFGPRYLHSKGQYNKGGPNTGAFIQFISSSNADITIPEQNYSFDQLKKAQAIGDMEALIKHKRRVILIDLGKDILNGLEIFSKVLKKAQSSLSHEEKHPKEIPILSDGHHYLQIYASTMT